jgi:predicted ATPase
MTCACNLPDHTPRLVVLTGGPGAGKTAVLEIVKRHFCEHIQILPESASIVFGGGFPRGTTLPLRCGAQRAIYHVQRELEATALDTRRAAVVLCDRGTVDGLAYWPLDEASWCAQLRTSAAEEIARYATVIHLRTPPLERGYNHANPVRTETAREAHEADARIERAWSTHPRRAFVECHDDFLQKVARTVALIREEVPPCCRKHRIPETDG